MAASQQYISGTTPMGATLIANGATFRVWAPGADHVYVVLNGVNNYAPQPADELVKNAVNGHWTGFFPGVADDTRYRYFIVHGQRSGFKRDPWARELEFSGYPDCDCIVRAADTYPWHDQDFHPPAFSDLIVYQFHVGVFFARDEQGNDIRTNRVSKFLDVLDRIEYLADLGVNALQPLPLVEFQGYWSLGYNGTDLFSPEMDYCVDTPDLNRYLIKVNNLLAKKNQPPLSEAELGGQVNQLKAFMDICHLYGLAVIVDVVYNHAGGNLEAQSIDYFDLPPNPDKSNSIYFSQDDWAGGRVFDFHKPEVQDFLINNARMFLIDYHADGIRFDEVSVIDQFGGWFFCQNITDTLRYEKPEAALIAEYWRDSKWLAVWERPAGMGFDIGYNDLLRDALRTVVAEAASGADATVPMSLLKRGLEKPENFPFAWQAYNCIENHDFILDADGDHRKPRIPTLADGDDPRSWYARSRSRVALGLLLTAPGIPMLFMGQEFLEDKLWSDDPEKAGLFIGWDGLEGKDRHMSDFHRFVRDLLWLRRGQPALQSEAIDVYHVDDNNRVLAFHRWVPGTGQNVVVVVSLHESTFFNYELGFPLEGHWGEVFNSDVYDNFANPQVQGNPGGVSAGDNPLHGLEYSAGITLPANGLLIFVHDGQ